MEEDSIFGSFLASEGAGAPAASFLTASQQVDLPLLLQSQASVGNILNISSADLEENNEQKETSKEETLVDKHVREILSIKERAAAAASRRCFDSVLFVTNPKQVELEEASGRKVEKVLTDIINKIDQMLNSIYTEKNKVLHSLGDEARDICLQIQSQINKP